MTKPAQLTRSSWASWTSSLLSSRLFILMVSCPEELLRPAAFKSQQNWCFRYVFFLTHHHSWKNLRKNKKKKGTWVPFVRTVYAFQSICFYPITQYHFANLWLIAKLDQGFILYVSLLYMDYPCQWLQNGTKLAQWSIFYITYDSSQI